MNKKIILAVAAIGMLNLAACSKKEEKSSVVLKEEKSTQDAKNLNNIAVIRNDAKEIEIGRKEYDESTKKVVYKGYSKFSKVCVDGIIYIYSDSYVYTSIGSALVDNITPYVRVNPATNTIEYERCTMEIQQ